MRNHPGAIASPNGSSGTYVTVTRTGVASKRRGQRLLTTLRRLERFGLWAIALVAVWLIWALIASAINKAILMPSPVATVRAAWQMLVTGPTIYGQIAQSAREAGIGFGLSMIGIPLGLMIGTSRRLYLMFEPINAAAYSLPHIALVPVAIVWFGLGIWSKVFMVFISTFFLIVINTADGAGTVGKELNDVATAFRVSRFRRFLTVTAPGTFPFIVTAIRLGIGRALVGVVAAEMFAGNSGLGYLLTVYGNDFRTASLFVDIAIFAVAGGILSILVGVVERRFSRWKIA